MELFSFYHEYPPDANTSIIFEEKSLVISKIYLMRSIRYLHAGKLHSRIEEIATEILISRIPHQCHSDHI